MSGLADLPAEGPRIDARYELGAYRHGFVTVEDPSKPARGLGIPGPGPMTCSTPPTCPRGRCAS